MPGVIVTGASRGLGRTIAKRLLEEGYNVFGLARTAPDQAGIEFVRCDVTEYDDVKQAARSIKSKDIEIAGLVNAAGIASMNLVFSTPRETIDDILSVNLTGTIYCCQQFGKLLARGKGGSIVNVSTIAVRIGLEGEAVYVASKAGVEGFTKSFAREMADFGVTVNAIAPGPIDTDLIKNVPADKIENVVRHQIIRKQATPDDAADIVSLLLDKRARMLTGQVFHIGGA